MATWQEIPAHRILVVDEVELLRDFELLDEDSNVLTVTTPLPITAEIKLTDEQLAGFKEEFEQTWRSSWPAGTRPLVLTHTSVEFAPVVAVMRRRSDGKLFRWAEWVPAAGFVKCQVALRETCVTIPLAPTAKTTPHGA